MHLLPLLLVLFSLPYPSLSSTNTSINWWCNQTPHPKACLYYLTHTPLPPKHKSDFYHLSLQVTFHNALRAQRRVQSLASRCRTEPRRTAWLDCHRLYTNTVLQLNRTLNPSPSCTSFDFQTWLSAALTNLDTCRHGFSDLHQPPKLLSPLGKYNISELISNCLAINKPQSTPKPDIPPWITVANRKLLQISSNANVVVAKDGSGDFTSINAALNSAAAKTRSLNARFVIHVKRGVYSENVQIVSSMNNITLVGDGMGRTVITGRRSVSGGYTTFSSATFNVFGDGFIASGITFRNTFGPGSQAVAMLSGSDRSVFYRCSFEGYQDTLFVYSQRQFYRECNIYGTIDFIFGNAAVVFQRCNIYVRKPRHGEANAITAQGRLDKNQNTGIVIHSSNIRGTSDLRNAGKTVRSYLGRPWMRYSRTVLLKNYIESIIDPAGWLQFNGNFALDTLYYVEYKNTGAGSRLSKRVKWPGFHIVVRPSQVAQFTVANFIAGGSWITSAGVPFVSGL
ncbi:hypothetical protein J5N97_019088 [Dioscorea zingiberensis]|uniref:Pectinesterase n=1 Tax=Dioscorea zingiberensis TaxID=325984 RepID=A0A9D5CDY6_9LILI|nr:hypothetical protein J5N97_019088 [Dioscorea zingiberensis]